MIEVKTKLGKTEVSVSESLATLCTDTVQIVRAIYNAILDRDDKAGEAFKEMMEKDLCRMSFRKNGDASEIGDILEGLEELIKLIKD